MPSVNQFSVEQRELTLSFERIRITTRIHIAHDAQLYLVARVEIAKVSRITTHKKIAGVKR